MEKVRNFIMRAVDLNTTGTSIHAPVMVRIQHDNMHAFFPEETLTMTFAEAKADLKRNKTLERLMHKVLSDFQHMSLESVRILEIFKQMFINLSSIGLLHDVVNTTSTTTPTTDCARMQTIGTMELTLMERLLSLGNGESCAYIRIEIVALACHAGFDPHTPITDPYFPTPVHPFTRCYAPNHVLDFIMLCTLFDVRIDISFPTLKRCSGAPLFMHLLRFRNGCDIVTRLALGDDNVTTADIACSSLQLQRMKHNLPKKQVCVAEYPPKRLLAELSPKMTITHELTECQQSAIEAVGFAHVHGQLFLAQRDAGSLLSRLPSDIHNIVLKCYGRNKMEPRPRHLPPKRDWCIEVEEQSK